MARLEMPLVRRRPLTSRHTNPSLRDLIAQVTLLPAWKCLECVGRRLTSRRAKTSPFPPFPLSVPSTRAHLSPQVVPWLFSLARLAVAAPAQPAAEPDIATLVADTHAELAAHTHHTHGHSHSHSTEPHTSWAAAVYPAPAPRHRAPLPFPLPALAHKQLFWRVSSLCYALGCARPESLGIYFWTHFPTVKNLMLMTIR